MEVLLAPACATEQFCRREESEQARPGSMAMNQAGPIFTKGAM